jgi:DNA-binding MarR family transcriptional regulator
MSRKRRDLGVDLSFPSITPVELPTTSPWKHKALFDEGLISLPINFLHLYAHLRPYPLSQGEALFILQLVTSMSLTQGLFPSYLLIAKHMNVTDKMVRKHAQNLERKKYLKRVRRPGRTNYFDLTGLFDALLACCKKSEEEVRHV